MFTPSIVRLPELLLGLPSPPPAKPGATVVLSITRLALKSSASVLTSFVAAPSDAFCFWFKNVGIAIAARIANIATTTNSSMRENPAACFFPRPSPQLSDEPSTVAAAHVITLLKYGGGETSVHLFSFTVSARVSPLLCFLCPAYCFPAKTLAPTD